VELLVGGIVLDHSRLQTRIATALAEAVALPPHQGAGLVRRLEQMIDKGDRIQKKNEALDSEDFGQDLHSTLQRKHEGVKRDLAASDDKIRTLDEKVRK
jgi:hypothetical protein